MLTWSWSHICKVGSLSTLLLLLLVPFELVNYFSSLIQYWICNNTLGPFVNYLILAPHVACTFLFLISIYQSFPLDFSRVALRYCLYLVHLCPLKLEEQEADLVG
jgi:hypothetical protein